jgi:hypothetical protein
LSQSGLVEFLHDVDQAAHFSCGIIWDKQRHFVIPFDLGEFRVRHGSSNLSHTSMVLVSFRLIRSYSTTNRPTTLREYVVTGADLASSEGRIATMNGIARLDGR